MSTYNTYVTYDGDGLTTEFSIPFSYDSDSEVLVFVNRIASVSHSFTSPGIISFSSAPDVDDEVLITRDTSVSTPAVVWGQETVLGKDVNSFATQVINKLQELSTVSSDLLPHLGAIENIDQIATGVQTAADDAVAAAATATTKAGEAATSATNAASSATSAGSSASSASGSAATATTKASDASASAATATTKASEASASAASAAVSASTATTKANAATVSANEAASSAATSGTNATQAINSANAAAASATTATTQANSAATSATNAATSATNAATSATNASNSAGLASTLASIASSSASSASSAQIAAEAARDATLASFDSFDDRYLGAKTSDPTLDNDGAALVAGALYFNSTSGAMKVYTGSVWVAAYVSGSGYLAAANNLSDVSSTSAARSNLGLAIGTDVQANLGYTPVNKAGDTMTGPLTVSGSSSGDLVRITQTGAGNALLVEDSANPDATPFVIDASGNVGIGTNIPSSKLVVSDGTILIDTSPFSGVAYYGTSTNHPLAIITNNAERMRIDSSGNVGIGQNYGLQKLTVAGQSPGANGAYATNQGSIVLNETGRNSVNDAGGLEFKASVFASGYGAKIIGMDNGSLAFGWRANSATFTESMRITNAGTVLIGTTTATGNVITTGNTDSTTTSITNQYHQYNSGATSGSGTKTGSNILMVALPAYAGTGAWLAYNGGMTNQSPNTVSQFRSFNASYVTTGGGTLTNYYGYFANDTTLTSGTVTNTYGFYGNISSGTGKFNVYAAGTANNYFAGNVGIGTASPSEKLTVNGTVRALAFTLATNQHLIYDIDATNIGIRIGAAGPYYTIGTTGSSNLRLNNASGGDILFATSSTERMRIDSIGNYFLGTADTSPNIVNIGYGATGNRHALTDYIGDTTYTDYGLRVGRYNDGANGTSILDHRGTGALKLNVVDSGYMVFATSSTERMRIDSSGNVGIGTTTFGTSASKVLALGNATAPTTGPADTIQIYSSDLSAGNTMLSLYTEGTPVNENTTAEATHRIAIRVNGTVYYLLANTYA